LHRCKDSVRHHNVTVNGDQYTFGLASFDSLNEFLEHFENQPVVAGQSGEKLFFVCRDILILSCCFMAYCLHWFDAVDCATGHVI